MTSKDEYSNLPLLRLGDESFVRGNSRKGDIAHACLAGHGMDRRGPNLP